MLNLDRLHEAVRAEGGVSRRLFLAYGAALSAIADRRRPGRGPDRHGASSPPTRSPSGSRRATRRHAGVVLWTRLAPKPLDPDGGLPPEAVEVRLGARDRRRDEAGRSPGHGDRHPAARRTPSTSRSDGLEPDRWYWYRFRAGDATSPVGRTRTMPAADGAARDAAVRVRLVPALRDGPTTPPTSTWPTTTSTWSFHLGDYIYEDRAGTAWSGSTPGAKSDSARRLPDPPRPVQDRPAPAGHARPLPLGGDVGRPRVREQLRRRRSRRRPGCRSGRVPGAAGERLPGVLRDDAAAAPVAAARAAHEAVSDASRSAGWRGSRCSTRASIAPTSPTATAAADAERRRARPEEHDPRRRGRPDWLKAALLRVDRRPGTCSPSR